MIYRQLAVLYTVSLILFLSLTCDYMNPASGIKSEEDDIFKNMNTDTLPSLTLSSLDTVVTIPWNNTTRVFRLSVDTGKTYFIEATSSSSGCTGFSILDSTYKSVYSKSTVNSGDIAESTYFSSGKYFLVLKNNCPASGSVSISLLVDNSEPDNTRGTARIVEVNGSSLTGMLGNYDTDMFKFAAKKDSCYKIIVSNALNIRLTLLRPDSSVYLSSISSTEPSTLSFKCMETETYYFTITYTNYSSGNQKNSYTCSVNTLPLDSYEPDDSMHQATLLPVDGTVQTHTCSSIDVDWMKCKIRKGYYYLLKINGAGYGTGIYTDKKALITNLGTNDSLFFWGVASSDSIVYIKIGNEQTNGYNGSNMILNSYTISVTEFPIDQYEPDDDPVNTRLIRVGEEAIKGALITNDIDWVKFNVKAGSTYDILGTGNTSFKIGLYKSSDFTYISSRSSGLHNAYTATSDDTIYLKIGEWSGTTISTFRATSTIKSPVYEYSIKVNTIQNDTFEYDNTLKSAKPITTDGTIQKRIFTAGDTDVIKFNAIADSSYLITVSSTYRIRLFSDSSTILRTQYNSSNSSAGITLKWMCTVSGTYYFDIIKPDMGNSLFLEYTVSVKTFKNDPFEPDNIMSMATILDTTKTPPTHTLIQNDVDWYKFTVHPGIMLKFSTTGTRNLPVWGYSSKNDSLYYSDTFPSYLLWSNFDTTTEIYLKIGPLSEKTIKAHENDSLTCYYSLKADPLYNDTYEPDNSMKTASAITLNEKAQSRILMYKERDYIKLDCVKDSSYKVTLSNILKMSLINASGNILYTRSWPSAGTLNSFKWTCLESGSYYVKIDSTSQNWSIQGDNFKISYTISFESAQGDKYEPDNTAATATLIKADTVKQHHSLFILDVDWLKFTGQKGTEYQFFCEQQLSTQPNVNMSLYLNDGITKFQSTFISGSKWICPADGDYCLRFWVDTKSALNNSEWEYTTYIQKGSTTTDTGTDIRSTAEVGYFNVHQSLIVPVSSKSWLKINMQNDNLYQICIVSASPLTCTLFGNNLITEIIPLSTTVRNIGNAIVQVYVWKPSKTEMHYLSFNNTGSNLTAANFFIVPFNNDAYEPDTLVSQLHTISTDSIPIYRTLSANDTSDAVLFHGIDGKTYKLGMASDSVVLRVQTQSATGAKLTLLESQPGLMRVSCSGTGDFVINFVPSGFSGRVLSYLFYVKEE